MLHNFEAQATDGVDISQGHLVKQLIPFIKKYSPRDKRDDTLAVFEKMRDALEKKTETPEENLGYCVGFTSLVLNAVHATFHPADSKLQTSEPVYTWSQLKTILEKISLWDGNSTLSTTDIKEFNFVLNQVVKFQKNQAKLIENLRNAAGNTAQVAYALAGGFSLKDLNKNTILQQTIMESRPTFVSSPDHITGLYKIEGCFILYDSVFKSGLRVYDASNPDRLKTLSSDLLFDLQFEDFVLNRVPISIVECGFDFDSSHEAKLPPPAELLAKRVSKTSQTDFPELCIAARDGCLESVKYLLKDKADTEVCDRFGNTPLFLAARWNHIEVMKELITHKAKLEAATHNNENCLFVAVAAGHIAAAVLLLTSASDNTVKNKLLNTAEKILGRTPLFVACENGQIDVVKLLLQHGADISLGTIYNTTPVMIAAQKNHPDIVKLLLEKMLETDPDILKKILAKAETLNQENTDAKANVAPVAPVAPSTEEEENIFAKPKKKQAPAPAPDPLIEKLFNNEQCAKLIPEVAKKLQAELRQKAVSTEEHSTHSPHSPRKFKQAAAVAAPASDQGKNVLGKQGKV